MENADDRPYLMYVAVLDSRTRPAHKALHGKIFHMDDPFWDSFYPPNGWKCRCRTRALTEGQAIQRYGRKPAPSGDRLSEADALVSKSTGELRPVAVYKDTLTSMKISPDPGFSCNPGKAAWFPDLDKYDYDVARKYIEGGLTGPDFGAFFKGRLKGNYPVAVLSSEEMDALGSSKQTVYLSSRTLDEHKDTHPEIGIADYQKIPDIIARGEVYQQSDERLIYLAEQGVLYRASLKRTGDMNENYFLSLFKTTDMKADKEVRKKFSRIR